MKPSARPATGLTVEQVLGFTEAQLQELPKSHLVTMLVWTREQLVEERDGHQAAEARLEETLAQQVRERQEARQREINQTVNQPSSKRPEWDKGEPARRKRRRNRRGRPGAGNRAKPEPDVRHENPLQECPECRTDLSDRPVLESPSRIVEDIAPPPAQTVVSQEVQQRKWCPKCQRIVSSQSERALPKSDIGLHASVLIAYLWVVLSVSLPGIVAYLRTFFRLTMSTAGVSRMMIRIGTILEPVHEEIRLDIKAGAMIFADETGWRIRGVLWWLWIFASSRSAYYWPDRQRGSPVVEKILGTVFSGTTEKVEERPSLAIGAVGALPEQGALHAGRAIDFHDMKGVVEQVLARFQARSVYFDRFPPEAGLTPEWLHSYRSARVAIDGATVGWFGQLHPREAAARKLKEPVLVGELYLDRLYKLNLRQPIAKEISRFQPVRRDFSLVLNESVTWEKVDQAVASVQIPELVEWRAREVFRDAKLGAGEYSLLLGATFQAADRTLREEELQSFQAQVVEAVSKVGARLRG